ncbi:FliO/MopB family protein [Treponema sp.]|uniref:FliO/MopB family protein n=1 Tax=Treponema sp. TaxID=166 RepID=UPI003F0F3995
MNFKIKKILVLFFVCCGLAFASESSGDEISESAQNENNVVSMNFMENSDSAEQVNPVQSSYKSPSGIGIFVRMILVLGIVVAAIYFMFKFMRRSMVSGDFAAEDDVFLRRVSTVSLGEGKSVQIVTLWNRAFILGVSENSVSLIKEIEDKNLIDAMNQYSDMNSKVKKPRTFEEILQLFMPSKKEESAEQNEAPKKSAYDSNTMNLINSLKEKMIGGNEK